MADKFREGDVVTYMLGDLGAFEATVTRRRADLASVRGCEAYNADLPNDRGQGLMYSDEMTLVKRTTFEKGDRVAANETISRGSHTVKPGDQGIVKETSETRQFGESQFLRIQWDEGDLIGVYSSRVDYLEPATEPIIMGLPGNLKPALTYEDLAKGGKIFFSDVKDPEHITVTDIGTLQNISNYTTSLNGFSWSEDGVTYDEADLEDVVTAPNHYTEGMPEGIEVRDIIKAQGFWKEFCAGNVIKYNLRWQYKNGVEDLKKMLQYGQWLVEELEAEDV